MSCVAVCFLPRIAYYSAVAFATYEWRSSALTDIILYRGLCIDSS
jgi:hypothetical protein